jgi:hypothetical protein
VWLDLVPPPHPTVDVSRQEAWLASHQELSERWWPKPLTFRISYSVDEPNPDQPLSLWALEDLGLRLRDPLDRRTARERGEVVGGWSYLLQEQDELARLPPEVRQLVTRLAAREQQEWH